MMEIARGIDLAHFQLILIEMFVLQSIMWCFILLNYQNKVISCSTFDSENKALYLIIINIDI